MAYSRYQYETSPRKLQQEYEEIKTKRLKKSTSKKTSKKNKNKANKLKHAKILLYVALGFSTLFVISYRYSQIDETYSELIGLEDDLGAIKKETAQLEANIESTLNLTKIEEDAKELLGMQKLSGDQITWISLPKTDYVESSSEEIKDNNSNTNWFMQIINKIMETLK